jgi:hypothetical protein
VSRFVATRRFLEGHDAGWIEAWRRRLADVLVRALEAYAAASLGWAGPSWPPRSGPPWS